MPPIKYTVKVGKVGDSLRITIPKPLAEAHDLHIGDHVKLEDSPEHIIITKEKQKK